MKSTCLPVADNRRQQTGQLIGACIDRPQMTMRHSPPIWEMSPMKSRLLTSFCILVLGIFLVSRAVLAHHGFAGRDDEEHPFTVEGTVLESDFINPHSAIFLEANDQGAASQRCKAALTGANFPHTAAGCA